MKTFAMMRSLALAAALVGLNAATGWAADAAREDHSELFVWIFLAFCALIVIAQLIPAFMMMTGLAKGVKKETLQPAPAVVDQTTTLEE